MHYPTTEFVEETFDQVRHMTRALYSLLLESGKVSELDLIQYFAQEEQRELTHHAKMSPIVEMNCSKCGRRAVVRMDRDVKCMFCGMRLDPQQHRMNPESADKSTQETLFSCQIIDEDIGQRSFFVGTSPKDDSVDMLLKERESHRNSYYMKDNPQMQLAASFVVAGMTTALINNQASGIPVDPKKDYIGRMNRKMDRLCKALKVLWNIASKEFAGQMQTDQQRADQGKDFLETLSRVSKSKLEKKDVSTKALAACPHCRTVNLRTTLFFVSCTSCGKEITLPLLPGLGVYNPSDKPSEQEPVCRFRKKEYLYTLFEAVFEYTAQAFGHTWADLSRIVYRDFDICEEKKENERRVCTHCGRPIPESSQIGNQCVYCGKANGASALERFL